MGKDVLETTRERERERKEGKEGKGREGKGREGKGREGKERKTPKAMVFLTARFPRVHCLVVCILIGSVCEGSRRPHF
jgi:hypothetical protein